MSDHHEYLVVGIGTDVEFECRHCITLDAAIQKARFYLTRCHSAAVYRDGECYWAVGKPFLVLQPDRVITQDNQ